MVMFTVKQFYAKAGWYTEHFIIIILASIHFSRDRFLYKRARNTLTKPGINMNLNLWPRL